MLGVSFWPTLSVRRSSSGSSKLCRINLKCSRHLNVPESGDGASTLTSATLFLFCTSSSEASRRILLSIFSLSVDFPGMPHSHPAAGSAGVCQQDWLWVVVQLEHIRVVFHFVDTSEFYAMDFELNNAALLCWDSDQKRSMRRCRRVAMALTRIRSMRLRVSVEAFRLEYREESLLGKALNPFRSVKNPSSLPKTPDKSRFLLPTLLSKSRTACTTHSHRCLGQKVTIVVGGAVAGRNLRPQLEGSVEKVNELRIRLEAKPLHRGWESNWEKLSNSSNEIAAPHFDELTAHLNEIRRNGPF